MNRRPWPAIDDRWLRVRRRGDAGAAVGGVSPRRSKRNASEQLPLPEPSPKPSLARRSKEQAAKVAIAPRAKPSAVPGHVKLTITVELERALAERLSARAQRGEESRRAHPRAATGGDGGVTPPRWVDTDGRSLATRPCHRCHAPTPIFRMTVQDVLRNGWICYCRPSPCPGAGMAERRSFPFRVRTGGAGRRRLGTRRDPHHRRDERSAPAMIAAIYARKSTDHNTLDEKR